MSALVLSAIPTESKRRLLSYLESYDGSQGCLTRYEQKISGGSAGFMAGHYCALLDTLVDALGGRKALGSRLRDDLETDCSIDPVRAEYEARITIDRLQRENAELRARAAVQP